MIPRNLTALRARANHAPVQQRLPLLAGERTIGSVSAALGAALQIQKHLVVRAGDALRLVGDTVPTLQALAQCLRQQGHAGAWRGEELAVHDETGTLVGSIERAVVRPLGIATRAVHLVGTTADGRIWLQQRAHNKATDPGKWDTLMGGMIAAAESLETATTRETWEEAGLKLDPLGGFHALQDLGIVQFRRPVPDSGTDGYLVERIHALQTVVPAHLTPVNQDGEVAQFELVTTETLAARIEAEQLTLEAALIVARCFGW